MARVIGGRRTEVLAAVKTVRGVAESHPKLTSSERAGSGAGNHLASGASESRDADQLKSNGTVRFQLDSHGSVEEVEE